MSALRTTGSAVAGRTRPTAPTSRAASSIAATGSPRVSARPTRTRLPSAWPSSSPAVNRCSNAPAQRLPGAASATRHLRRSPGGRTSRSRRSRPEDPPSSATLTTAVMSPAYWRAARSATARPWPPPSATTRGRSLTFEVPVVDPDGEAEPVEQLGQLGGDDDAAVPPAGASDPDRQVRLAFACERGEQELEQAPQLLEERAGFGLSAHVAADLRVGAGQRSQRVHPVRVRQEATVEHQVDVEGDAVLVAERHDAGLQRPGGGLGVAEQLVEPVAQLVHVEVRGVDDEIGFAFEPFEQGPLLADPV